MNVRVALASVLGALVAMLSVGVVTAPAALAGECPNEALRSGPSASLPDCRGYEQVSPANKAGYDAVPREALAPVWISPDGEGIAYLDYGAFPGAAGNDALSAAHLSEHGATGWHTTELTPPKPQAAPFESYLVGYDFSEYLEDEITKVPLQPLTAEATPGVYNLFFRHPDGSYSWVNAARPPVLPSEVIPSPKAFILVDQVAFAGASRDFHHILFESNAPLTPEAPSAFLAESLYESFEGKLRLVGILPDGTPAAAGATAGAGSSSYYISGEIKQPAGDKRVEHAISEDGETVVFQAKADGGIPDPEQSGDQEVYVRIGGKETVEASAPNPGATPELNKAEPATFWAASADGSRVFFTTKAELTTAASTGEDKFEALYEYNVKTKEVRDLSPDTNPLDVKTGPRVLGVVGTSKDGEYVYFVADGQLVAGEGTHSRPNLYMVHNGGAPVFIATLDYKADTRDWTDSPAELEAYVTPDGRHVAFMSTMSLPTGRFPTGYDNTIPSSGKSASEVYEYSAPTAAEEANDEAGSLVCASCDPTGAPPSGNAYIGGIAESEGKLSSASTPFAHVRAMSDSGDRVFFTAPPLESEIALDPLETPYQKVYEYERAGSSSCGKRPGCVFLLSGAESKESASFLGASEEGENVFIGTDSQLVASDTGNLVDVYDARAGGGTPAAQAETACESGCRPDGGPGPSGPSLASGLTGRSGNLPASAPVKTTGNANASSKARKQAKRRKHRLRDCRRHARRVHRRSRSKRKRALRRCARRYGPRARRGRAARREGHRRHRRSVGRSASRRHHRNTRRGA